MIQIVLWKDRERGIVDPELFSLKAKDLAEQIAEDNKNSKGGKANKRTQIRKFYDEVVRLDMEARSREGQWENILPLLHMLIAKAAYANGRELLSENFMDFIKSCVNEIKESKDLMVFANFFEAFMGYYQLFGPRN